MVETTPPQHTHSTGQTHMMDCPACLVKPGSSNSAKIAWGVAILALVLLATVLLIGPGTTGGTIAGVGGLVLLGALICPLTMGAMMFFMMRNTH